MLWRRLGWRTTDSRKRNGSEVEMTRPIGIAVVVPLLLLPICLPAEARASGPEDEVRAAFSSFSRAFLEADAGTLRSLLTVDYLHVNGRSGSVLNREEWLDFIRSRRAELASGELTVSVYEVDAVEVRVHGETAIVTGVVESRGVRREVPFVSRIRFTNVWVRQGGVWLRAAFHDSPLPDS
jgi:hypothetical protein